MRMFKVNKNEMIMMKLVEKKEVVKVKAKGRKEQVLDLINANGGKITINEISRVLGINNRNVSSQLCYLKNDGYVIISYKMNKETYVEMRG